MLWWKKNYYSIPVPHCDLTVNQLDIIQQRANKPWGWFVKCLKNKNTYTLSNKRKYDYIELNEEYVNPRNVECEKCKKEEGIQYGHEFVRVDILNSQLGREFLIGEYKTDSYYPFCISLRYETMYIGGYVPSYSNHKNPIIFDADFYFLNLKLTGTFCNGEPKENELVCTKNGIKYTIWVAKSAVYYTRDNIVLYSLPIDICWKEFTSLRILSDLLPSQ
jgi:hypothetical protein